MKLAFVALLDSQALTGQNGRDVDFLAVHADASASCDQDVTVVQGVSQLGQPAVRPGAGQIHLGWGLHAQCFVGPL
jgi:hypothetical protein